MTNTSHLNAVERRAQAALREHGLTQEGWTFRWDRAVRRFGMCNYSKKRITVSRTLAALNDFAKSEDTILHEIAHALVGRGVGHGPKWVAQATAIGCNGERCYSARTVGDRDPHSARVAEPPDNWVGTCPRCRAVVARRIRRPRRRVACSRCCRRHARNRFDARFTLVWTPNDALEQLNTLIQRGDRPNGY